MKQKTLSQHYKEKYGCKVYKLSIDGGMTCPNRDGKLGTGGCIYCSLSGSGDFAEKANGDIITQLENAKLRVQDKNKDGKYIAYFQPFTNTYAPIDYLEKIYYEAIKPDYIVGLAIATRPDCLGDDVIALLSEINKIKPVSVELGLQTIHDKTAEYINRGYKTEIYYDAVKKLKENNLEVVTHMIIGLPDETDEMIVETAKAIGKTGCDGIKLHLLYVLKNTRLAEDYRQGKFETLTLEKYAELLKKCLDVLPEDIIIHRLTGDGAKKDLLSPLWSGDKKRVLNYINSVI
ncbi:MAG: TIGR01212 family radical SAM protein [Clostridia bacterium]|nr:TIGR01212 family radical SAM protein [Clostridia bacterium]